MDEDFIPKITLFHCINSFNDGDSLTLSGEDDFELRIVRLPCSGMLREVFVLKAFEAGSDAVVVLACPEGDCRYVEGNIRARKRVERVKGLLDEIGIDGSRLSIFNVSPEDKAQAAQVIQGTLSELADLGPNPAT